MTSGNNGDGSSSNPYQPPTKIPFDGGRTWGRIVRQVMLASGVAVGIVLIALAALIVYVSLTTTGGSWRLIFAACFLLVAGLTMIGIMFRNWS